MTKSEAEAVAEALKMATEPLHKRLQVLEAAAGITAPAAQKARHRGSWTLGRSYQVGDATVHKGALWVCGDDTAFYEPGGHDGIWIRAREQ